MSKDVGHRSSEDLDWQEVKKQCRLRDKNMCVCCRCLTPGEYALFMRSGPVGLNNLQVAHIEPVGSHYEKTYDINNVILLCAEHHQRIDGMRDLITNKKMKSSDHDAWWDRLKKEAGIN